MEEIKECKDKIDTARDKIKEEFNKFKQVMGIVDNSGPKDKKVGGAGK